MIIEGSHELVAAIDQVKYFGNNPDVGQAMSYVTEGPHEAESGQELAMPLIQKGNPNTGNGDTSGVQLFNTDSDNSVDAEIVFYGANGNPVAPTVQDNDAEPIEISVPAYGNYTLYAHGQSELSSGFQGSLVVYHEGGQGELVGVSNNVNYEVQGDGSSAFNLIRTEPRVGTDLTIEQSSDENLLGEDHEVIATLLDQFGAPMPGEDVEIDVDHGFSFDDRFDQTFNGTTNGVGQFQVSYSQTAGQALGADIETIVATHDEAGDSTPLSHTWDAEIAIAHVLGGDELTDNDGNPVNPTGEDHSVSATVTGAGGIAIEDAEVEVLAQQVGGPASETQTHLTGVGGQIQTLGWDPGEAGSATYTASLTATGTSAGPITKVWQDREGSILTLEPLSAGPALYGDPHTVTATLLDQFDDPIEGETIDVTASNDGDRTDITDDGTTNASGQATVTYSQVYGDGTASTDSITAIHTASGVTEEQSASMSWEAGTGLSVSLAGNDTQQTLRVGVDLAATVTNVNGNPVGGVEVAFVSETDTNGTVALGTATTNSAGQAVLAGHSHDELEDEAITATEQATGNGYDDGVTLSWSPAVYTASSDETARKLDRDGDEVWSFTGHAVGANAVAVDADGYVYTAASDFTVRKLDSDGNQVWSFDGHNAAVYDVAVDADGNVYTASDDHTVRKVNSDGDQVWSFTGHNLPVFGVAVDADGNVYTASVDNTVRKVNSNGDQVESFGLTDEVYDVAVDAAGNVYIASDDYTVRKLDSAGTELWSFNEHDRPVWGVAVDADGYVYTASDDHTVRKLDSDGDQVWSFTGHTADVFAVAVDADGNVYTASSDETVRKVDSDGDQVWSFTGHFADVNGVAVDPGLYGAFPDEWD